MGRDHTDEEGDWSEIRMLDNRVRHGQGLEFTEEVRDLLRRTAPTVGLREAEAEAGLASPATRLSLLNELRRRIDEGSNRLMDALHRMYRLRDRGAWDEARQQLREVLAVEVVPLYRDIAQSELAKLDEPGP